MIKKWKWVLQSPYQVGRVLLSELKTEKEAYDNHHEGTVLGRIQESLVEEKEKKTFWVSSGRTSEGDIRCSSPYSTKEAAMMAGRYNFDWTGHQIHSFVREE